MYQQAFEHLEPGRGWIEQVEISLVPRFLYTQGDNVGNDFAHMEGKRLDSTAADHDKLDFRDLVQILARM